MTELKKELYDKKEEIRDIGKLVNKDIDKNYAVSLEDYSERELEAWMEEQLSYLDDAVDPFPDKTRITSHRKIIGQPIVWIKRFLLKITGVFITLTLNKQKIFNQKCVALFRTVILHQKKYRKKITQIEDRISECEVRLDAISRRIAELDSDGKQNEAKKS